MVSSCSGYGRRVVGVSAEWRASLQDRTAPVAIALSRMPRFLLIGIFGALVVVGLAGPGLVGVIPLLLIAAVGTWLLVLGWDLRSSTERLLRIVAVLLVIAFAVYKLI
jgi:hypothetical protein